MRNVAERKKHWTEPAFNMMTFLLLIVTCILLCIVKMSFLLIDLFDKDYQQETSLFIVDVLNCACMLVVCIFIVGILRNVARRHVFVPGNVRMFKYIGIVVEIYAVVLAFVSNMSDVYIMHVRTFIECVVAGSFMFFIAYLFDSGIRIEQGKEF